MFYRRNSNSVITMKRGTAAGPYAAVVAYLFKL